MKKILITLSITLLIWPAFSQVLKPVKIDSLVTVSLPVGYARKDTLGQQIYSGNGSLGYMVAIREANAKNNKPLKKANDLEKVFKDYISGIQKQSGTGSVQNLRDTIIGKRLKAKVFTLRTDDGNGTITLRNFILIYTQDATYTFEYVFPDTRTDLVKPEFRAYQSSIRLSRDLQLDDQYTDTKSKVGMRMPVKLAIGISLLVVIIVLFFVFKRKRAHH